MTNQTLEEMEAKLAAAVAVVSECDVAVDAARAQRRIAQEAVEQAEDTRTDASIAKWKVSRLVSLLKSNALVEAAEGPLMSRAELREQINSTVKSRHIGVADMRDPVFSATWGDAVLAHLEDAQRFNGLCKGELSQVALTVKATRGHYRTKSVHMSVGQQHRVWAVLQAHCLDRGGKHQTDDEETGAGTVCPPYLLRWSKDGEWVYPVEAAPDAD